MELVMKTIGSNPSKIVQTSIFSFCRMAFPIKQTVDNRREDVIYTSMDGSSAQKSVGGDIKEKQISTDYKFEANNFENNFTPSEGRKVQKNYEVENIFKRDRDPFSIKPNEYNSQEELFYAVCNHASDEQRKQESTIEHIERYARLMSSKDQPFPIDFFNLSYTQYRFHMKWYEKTYYNPLTGENYYGIKHRKDTILTFVNAYDMDIREWNRYRLPPKPVKKQILIIPPDIVHDIINYQFFNKDPDINKLIQYLHAHNFWIGWRVPSEPCIMTIDKLYDFKRPFITITEKKKHNTTRPVYLEDAILTGRTRKSLKNYVDKIRPKFESQYSKDFLYITPSEGKPFTPRYMGKLLSKTGKMVYPDYYPYCSRHWCATARLIQKWIEKHHDPLEFVKNFLGHDEQKTTETKYVRHAEEYFRRYNFDWIKRTLKFDKKIKEESALKSKQRLKTTVSNGNSPRDEYGPGRI
jgi:integrase